MESLDIAPAPPTTEGLGWEAFMDLAFITEMMLVLAMAVALAAVIAYHPVIRRKATTVAELEQPKTFIMYSMVGAIITIIVKTMPEMALVVFGIGGLLRFRTNVGEAKDTGRVILVTVVGLASGLGLYVVAVLTTVVAWALLFVLERQSVARMVIQGLDASSMARASEDYGAALRALGCRVIGEAKRVRKGNLAFVYRAPRELTRAQLEEHFANMPGAEQDTVGWDA